MPAKKKILVVEDDQFLIKVYKNKLEEEGFDVYLAVNGVEGIQKANEHMPDIILLDMMLPVKNGFEVLEDLKANDKTKDIPVMILSNLGQESDIEKGISLGAIDFLVKANYSINEVTDKIKDNLLKFKGDKKAAAPAKKSKCPACGAEISANAKFCPECGEKIK